MAAKRASRWARPAGHILAALALVWILAALIPITPFPIGVGVDASWNYGLNLAHAKQLVFGRDIIFTLGPLGYLTRPDPDYASKGAVLAFLLGSYACLIFGLFRCARAGGYAAALTAGAVLATLCLFSYQPMDYWQAGCVAVLLGVTAARDKTPVLDFAIAGVLSGLTLLLKFNDGIALCGVFYALLAWPLVTQGIPPRPQRLRLFALACVPLLTFQTGIVILQHNPLSSIPYLRNSLEVAAGYSEAMSFRGPLWQSGLALFSAIFVLAAPLVMPGAPRIPKGFAPAAIMAFIAFKHGMVRQDGHADVTQVKLAVAALFILVSYHAWRGWRLYAMFTLLCAGMTVCIVQENQLWVAQRAWSRMRLSGAKTSLAALYSFDNSWETLRRMIRQNLAGLRLDPRFHEIIGGASVDAFPNHIDVIRANGWDYRPRPIFQSYSAYTARLDEENARFLAGPLSAKYVILQFNSIDGRHPFLEDPRSWRALFDSYDIRLEDAKAILLEKRARPRGAELEPLGETAVGWNQDLRIPQVGEREAVVMSADIRRSVRGKLTTFLFRGAPVKLQATYASGRQLEFRAIRATVGGGAIVSPLPLDLSELGPFFGQPGAKAGERVVSVRWISPAPGEFQDVIRVSWHRLRLRPGESAAALSQ